MTRKIDGKLRTRRHRRERDSGEGRGGGRDDLALGRRARTARRHNAGPRCRKAAAKIAPARLAVPSASEMTLHAFRRAIYRKRCSIPVVHDHLLVVSRRRRGNIVSRDRRGGRGRFPRIILTARNVTLARAESSRFDTRTSRGALSLRQQRTLAANARCRLNRQRGRIVRIPGRLLTFPTLAARARCRIDHGSLAITRVG